MPLLPHQVSASSIRRARRFLELAGGKLPVSKAKNDLRRMAIVMAVAAIDSYMHAIVLNRVSRVRDKGELPKVLCRLEVRFEELASLADASIEARRGRRDARPWVQVKNVLQRRLLQMTFQSCEQVKTALALAGIEKGWSKVAKQLGEHPDTIKSRLDALVHRRNLIVHEGDVLRASRPRRIRFNEIAATATKADVDWTEGFLTAIEVVIASEP